MASPVLQSFAQPISMEIYPLAQAKQINQSMNSLEWGLLILLSIVWGGSFFFQGLAVKELPTFTIVTSRVVIAAIILWTIMAVLRIKMPMSRQV